MAATADQILRDWFRIVPYETRRQRLVQLVNQLPAGAQSVAKQTIRQDVVDEKERRRAALAEQTAAAEAERDEIGAGSL